ncbi:YodC family protein [Pseudomonas sp. SAR267]|uniref:YodC family protein n=1 Tax=Pseudomonas sp. SAR267 TaxID=3454502 RepID=UPI003F8EB14D
MPKEALFKVGDLVRIKSGGPVMTVKTVFDQSNSFDCQWFAGKKLEVGRFPSESLVPVEEEQK